MHDLLASINWSAVGVISGIIVACAGGLYTAIRNMRDDVKSDLGQKIDAVGDHQDAQDIRIDDARTRLGRLEGRVSRVINRGDSQND